MRPLDELVAQRHNFIGNTFEKSCALFAGDFTMRPEGPFGQFHGGIHIFFAGEMESGRQRFAVQRAGGAEGLPRAVAELVADKILAVQIHGSSNYHHRVAEQTDFQ